MDTHLSVVMDITNGGLLYQVFYTAAFLVAWVILVYEGYRRKFPLVTWILVLASIRLAVVAGTRLLAWTPEEWQFMIDNHVFIPAAGKTMFGGFAMGAVMYLAVSMILKFRHNAWDTVAYAFPAAVAVQSLGCFFYGCCFGTPSDLPWAVRYPVMSLAHYHQFGTGLISYGDSLSLPVHPVQLYETLGALAVVLLVWVVRKRWKAAGSLVLSSIVFFCVIRFGIEFFRDPLSNKTGGELFRGMKLVQWQYLIFGLIMMLLLIWRERRWKPAAQKINLQVPSLNIRLCLLLALLLLFVAIRNWFTLPEAIAMNMALLPAVVLTGIEVFRDFRVLKVRWAYAAILIMPLILMSQTIPQTESDSVAVKSYTTYHTVGGGFATGNYSVERKSFSGSGCGRTVNTNYYQQKHTSGTLGYIYTKKETGGNEIVSYGGNLTVGRFQVSAYDQGVDLSKALVDLNAFIKYDIRWIGVGTGLHLGSLYYNRGDSFSETADISTSHFWTPVMPSLYLRVGPERAFFADFHLADNFPSSAPGLAFMTGVGSGFGLRNGFKAKAGLSFSDENRWYFSAYIPIGDRLIIEPLYWFTGKTYYEFPGDSPENQFSLGLSYRFGQK